MTGSISPSVPRPLVVVVGAGFGGLAAVRFGYRDWGTLAVIGRSRAVATFGRVRLHGTPAWLAWALIHLGLLIDFRSRLLVYIDWAWEWLHGNRADRLILSLTPDRNAHY